MNEHMVISIIPDNIKQNLKVKKFELDEQVIVFGRSLGWSDEQVLQLYAVVQKISVDLQTAWEAIVKVLTPTIEFINEIYFENFDFNESPEKKQIYKSEYRLKSNVKDNRYMQNYRKRMFCCGSYGNFRRF